ncbi:MAG: OmpA family protein [Vicinamibacterales bacterium]
MRYHTAVVMLTIATLVGVTACGKRVQPVAVAPPPVPAVAEAPPPPPPPAEAAPAPATSATLSEDEIFARKTLEELNAERPLADALFDYDQWQVREDARSGLQKNAEWLRRWPSTRVTIEGHCDPRGTSEYNLALGDRRGNAVRDYLLSLGIARDRMVVVTKGEEAPVCASDTEECWQQNRRGHFVITEK